MESTLESFKKLLQEQIGCNPASVTLESRLREDLGADSLDCVEIQINVEIDHEIEVKDEDAETLLTVGDWVNYIDAHTK